MINTHLDNRIILKNIHTALPSRKCCVIETFLTCQLGIRQKHLYCWIDSLSPSESQKYLIILEGVVLDDFKTQFIKDARLYTIDKMYMVTSDGVRQLLKYYKDSFAPKPIKKEMDSLIQAFTNAFSQARTNRFMYNSFWEKEIFDAINMPDMQSINVNNSPGAVITTGDQNHHITSQSDTTPQPPSDKNQKPKWLIILSWIFIIGCFIGLIISIGIKYSETQSWENIHIDWKEWVSLGGLIIGILLKMY